MPFDRAEAIERIDLLIPAMTCAGCMTKVEKALAAAPGVRTARANLSAHTAWAEVDGAETDAEVLVTTLAAAGFDARPFDPTLHGAAQTDAVGRALLLRIGVAGFAAMNVMLLSISVWSGAEASMRDLLHWVSGLIALPTIAYAGQPFFQSAFAAIRARRLNMDVPISLAVILAAVNSVAETVQSGAHAYFDAAVMLLFFLLIGRYLEHRTRASARSAAAELMAMTGRTALCVLADGTRKVTALSDLTPGLVIEIAPGERIPADGTVTMGRSELDRSLITGESLPEPVAPGETVHAGMLNLTGVMGVEVTATGDGTLLAEIARMVDAAERGRGQLDRLADRAARLYVPLVHLFAAAAFVFWFAAADARTALQIAVAVLIVTCPCALALAVPTVHTVASTSLFRRGIFLKDGAELERLAAVDTVVFDKTGTLTGPEPGLACAPPSDHPAWPAAAALAAASRHPLSRAIVREADRRGISKASVIGITEQPGFGIEGSLNGHKARLGRPDWVTGGTNREAGVAFSMLGRTVWFIPAETLRPDAAETCAALVGEGLDLAILSGDRAGAVARVAEATAIATAEADLLPGDKLA
ncbi:MAG: heavy metal translocating P-type ATPase, partial [Pseudomonadota bacterium]